MRTILSARGVEAFLVGDETKIYLVALFLISWFVEMSAGKFRPASPILESMGKPG